MLKRSVLICLSTCLVSLAGQAIAEAKASPAQAAEVKPNEARGKIAPPETRTVDVPKRNRKWSNPALDLTHCLERSGNMEVIKCAH